MRVCVFVSEREKNSIPLVMSVFLCESIKVCSTCSEAEQMLLLRPIIAKNFDQRFIWAEILDK